MTHQPAPTHEFLLRANDVIRKTLQELRPVLLKASGEIEHKVKPDDTVVTQMDLMAEQTIHAALAELDPSIGLAGEETGADFEQPLFWLVDPIDGTEPFVRGLPFFTNMIALIHNGAPIMGVIYNPTFDEYFLAIKGHGTTMNGHPISVSQRTMKQAFVVNGSKFTDPHLQGITGRLRAQVKSISGYGGAGYTFTSIARGAIEGFLSYGTSAKQWDMAPGTLLVQEAGGIVTNVGSGDYNYMNTDLIAANPTIHPDLDAFINTQL